MPTQELSARELEICRLVPYKSPTEIARALNIAHGTVKVHLSNIYQKLSLKGPGAVSELKRLVEKGAIK